MPYATRAFAIKTSADTDPACSPEGVMSSMCLTRASAPLLFPLCH